MTTCAKSKHFHPCDETAGDEEQPCDDKSTKATRHTFDPPPDSEVDLKLAKKLDELLNINDNRKPKFLINKPRCGDTMAQSKRAIDDAIGDKIKPRHLSKDQLQQRLINKYDSLVPELDPKLSTVRVVKLMSTTESIEIGKDVARKQMQRQMELDSVSGNQLAHRGLKTFKFRDGYEMPMEEEPVGNRNVSEPSNYNHRAARIAQANLKTTSQDDCVGRSSERKVKFESNPPTRYGPDDNNSATDDDDSSDYDEDDDDIDDDESSGSDGYDTPETN